MMDGTLLKETEDGQKMTERNIYLNASSEPWDIEQRYTELRSHLLELYPIFFSNLSSESGFYESPKVEYLSREVAYILDILEEIDKSKTLSDSIEDFHIFGNTPPNNDPFTEREQRVIAEKLDVIEAQLIKTVRENAKINEDLKNNLDTKLNELANGIKELKESSSKIGRKDWYILFYGIFFNFLMTLCFSTEARTTLFSVIESLQLLSSPTKLC